MAPALHSANLETRDAWNANAAFWDQGMGEGNAFVTLLIWPATERLLEIKPGERVLDIACGNGLYARRLAALGAQVVAFDFAAEMIAHARDRQGAPAGPITYLVLDATDEQALLGLGERSYDAAICQMALMDMAEIGPLLRALARLLRPGGRFVCATAHPSFFNPTTTRVAEASEKDGVIATSYSVKVSSYMSHAVDHSVVREDQPQPHLFFHRPLQDILSACFSAGFVLDALEERAFSPDDLSGGNKLDWGARFSEIPPLLVARLRAPGGDR
jgi:SAM-dependent methyltransferase